MSGAMIGVGTVAATSSDAEAAITPFKIWQAIEDPLRAKKLSSWLSQNVPKKVRSARDLELTTIPSEDISKAYEQLSGRKITIHGAYWPYKEKARSIELGSDILNQQPTSEAAYLLAHEFGHATAHTYGSAFPDVHSSEGIADWIARKKYNAPETAIYKTAHKRGDLIGSPEGTPSENVFSRYLNRSITSDLSEDTLKATKRRKHLAELLKSWAAKNQSFPEPT